MAGKINKILVACIFAFSLVLVCSIAMAASQPAKIVGTNVNIRTAPNTSSSVVTKLSNSEVSIIKQTGSWYEISFSGKTGWVSGRYIKVLLTTNGKINANGVNFRATAGTKGKIIDSLSKGTSVEILNASSAGWYKVKVGLKVGYIVDRCVTSTKTAVKASNTAVKTSRSTTAETVDVSDDSAISKLIAYAKKFVGVRYVYGGMSPSGFDCSGFVGYVYQNFGIKLNRSAASMYSNGARISKSALAAGDILFFDASSRGAAGSIDHVGLYLGNNIFIHASTSNKKVVIEHLTDYYGTYIGAKRVM